MSGPGDIAAAPHTDAATLASLHARLLRDPALQFDFTRAPAPPKASTPDWLKALRDLLGRGFEAAAPALQVIFWVGLALCLVALAWIVMREVLGSRLGAWRRARRPSTAPVDWRADPLKARALLENADRLAAQGRFDQAVRLILHRGVEDIDDRRPRLVRPALTAREIASLDAVPAPARAAFARIAAVVEFSAFAGQPIGETAFAQCRAAYQAFAIPKAWA